MKERVIFVDEKRVIYVDQKYVIFVDEKRMIFVDKNVRFLRKVDSGGKWIPQTSCDSCGYGVVITTPKPFQNVVDLLVGPGF